MKTARLYSFDDIRIEEAPVPVPSEGEALVRTRASGICSGDVMQWYIEKKAPLVLGHEPSGEIVSVGNGVTKFKPGDRVFVHHHAPCLVCRFCRRGDYVQCETWKQAGIFPGAIAEYFLVSKTSLENDTLVLPTELNFEDGVLIEPLACAVKCIKRASIRPGDTVVVIGMGFMGLLNGMLAKKSQAGRVIGVDMVPYRLEAAKRLGFDDVINVKDRHLKDALSEMTGKEMAQIVIVGANNLRALKDGLSAVAPGGTVVMFSPVSPGEILSVDPNKLYFKDVSLVTSYSCGPTDTTDALELIKNGLVRAKDIVSHRFPIERTAEGYRLTALALDSIKSVILFN